MVYKSSNFNFSEQELAETLDKLGDELNLTTQELSEIGKTFGEKYEGSIWDIQKYLDGTNEVLWKIYGLVFEFLVINGKYVCGKV